MIARTPHGALCAWEQGSCQQWRTPAPHPLRRRAPAPLSTVEAGVVASPGTQRPHHHMLQGSRWCSAHPAWASGCWHARGAAMAAHAPPGVRICGVTATHASLGGGGSCKPPPGAPGLPAAPLQPAWMTLSTLPGTDHRRQGPPWGGGGVWWRGGRGAGAAAAVPQSCLPPLPPALLLLLLLLLQVTRIRKNTLRRRC
jgi:hypothetical protein